MSVVAIVQARMGARRLPGKVMMQLGSKPVIEHVVVRLQRAQLVDRIVVATTDCQRDKVIASWCKTKGIDLFCGSEDDVLDRYYNAARDFDAKVIVRVTADCPLIDPEVVDKVIEGFFAENFDAFGLSGEFPDGLDCQVFTFEAIQKAWKEATLASDREHVGSYIEITNSSRFKVGGIEVFKGLGSHRWTLDEPEDYIFLNAIVENLYKKNRDFRTSDVLNYLEENPDLKKINSGFIRNESYWSMRENEKKVFP